LFAQLSLLFDFGTLVLIWLVQLVIYPSFQYYPFQALIAWHKTYTLRVTFIVLPLLIGQFICTGYLLYHDYSMVLLIKEVGIILAWILTFGIFVPLHGKINEFEKVNSITEKLVSKNWWRTLIWTVVFILEIVRQLIPGLS